MASETVRAAPLTGGVSTQPPSNRFTTQTETSDNTIIFLARGLEKRYGGTFIGELDYTGEEFLLGNVHAVRREKDTIYFVVVDKGQESGNVVQVFGADGAKKTVTIVDSRAEDYIRSGSGNSEDVLRMKTEGDTTFIINQTKTVALTGTATDYNAISSLSSDDNLPVPATGTPGNYINLTTNQVGYPLGVYKILTTNDIGPWYERQVSPFDNSSIDATTMPVSLFYNPTTDSFTLDLFVWDDRKSGDSLVNPGPSFIGHKIRDLTVFENRLWISAGQQVVSSQTGDLFNFWQNDWATATDSDPIDISLSGTSVNAAEFLIPFNKTLLILSDGAAQWELQSLGAFTPSDTNLVETTNYSVSNLAFPKKIANQLYFFSDQGKHSFMWEYFPNFDRDSNIGKNVSKHIEGYLPKNIRRMSASENNNIIIAWSEQEPSNLYFYFSSWNVSEKQQEAWCRWVLDDEVEIKGHEAFDNTLYVILKKGTSVWLESIPITPPDDTSDGETTSEEFSLLAEDGEVLTSEGGSSIVLEKTTPTGIGYPANIDKKIVLTGVYDGSTKRTTFTLPFVDSAMDTVILGDSWGNRKGQAITATTDSSTTLSVSGDFSAYPCILGKSYSSQAELSPPFIKDESNIVVQGTFQLRTMDIMFEDAAVFEVDITPYGRPTRTRRYVSNRFGTAIIGAQNIQDFGRFNIQVRGAAFDTSIVLRNDSPFPSLFTNIEFMGGFVPRKNDPAKR